MICPKCNSQSIRYWSRTVSGEAMGDLWKCSDGCDDLPLWMHLFVGGILLLLVAMAVWY